MLRTALLTAAAVAAFAAPAMAQTPPAGEPATPATPTAPAAPATPAQATPAPNAGDNIIETLRTRGQYSTLLTALDQAQLTETLATRPRITLFAPTDAAFAALPEAERTRLLDPANAQELRNLLLYHVIVADLRPDQIAGARGPIATAGGLEVTIDGTGEAITVGSATVTQAAIDAANGGIYPIDKLLNPAEAGQGDNADDAAAPAAETPAAAAPADATTTPAPAAGVNAPNGQPAAAVTTTASPPVQNPTDGQVDKTEDPANPAPTPTPN